jgi:hypothetical protein
MDPRQATAVAAVAGALVRVVQAGEQEARLIALEQAITQWQADRARFSA